jgi:hypothetical protein
MSTTVVFDSLLLRHEDKENLAVPSLEERDSPVTLCEHAVAKGRHVFGFSSAEEACMSLSCSETKDSWKSWQTSLPHVVLQVVSNEDFVVVLTEQGGISLLCRRSGRLLTTRKVAGATLVGFVVGTDTSTDSTTTTATLFVAVPLPNDRDATKVLLVKHLETLLSKQQQQEESTSSTPSGSISIDSFTLPHAIQHLACIATSHTTLRIAVVTKPSSQLLIMDYIHHSNDSCLQPIHYEGDFLVVKSKLTVQTLGDAVYLLLVTQQQQVVWFHALQLLPATHWNIPVDTKTIHDLVVYHTLHPDTSCGVAMATTSHLWVLQVGVEETLGVTILGQPHVMHSIPHMHHHTNLVLTTRRDTRGTAIVWCAHHVKTQRIQCLALLPNPIVAQIRLLLHQRNFCQALQLCTNNNQDSTDYTHFHVTEIHLAQLHHVLSQPTPDSVNIAKESLHQLQLHLDENNPHSLQNMQQAVQAVLEWNSPTVSAHCWALKAMNEALQAAIQRTASSSSATSRFLQTLQTQLDEATRAMQALHRLPSAVTLQTLRVKTMQQLLHHLLIHSHTQHADTLVQTYKLPPDTVLATLVRLPHTIHPNVYLNLLRFSFFDLKGQVQHPIVPTVSAWACRMADEMVAHQHLDWALLLLTRLCTAYNQLQTTMFDSFASFCPFVDPTTQGTTTASSPRAATDTSIRSNDSSRKSTTTPASVSYDQPVPTLLELGRLKGGAVKSRILINTVHSNNDQDDDCDDIHVKLFQAQLLQRAQTMGLDYTQVSLRQFVKLGGALHLALELVRWKSRQAKSHDERLEALQGDVQSFCKESNLCFDEVLLSYGQEICNCKHMSQSMLMEASSLARCCSMDHSKCKLTLVVLRAALLCGAATPCLTILSKDAITAWSAGDLDMQSELTEASRILVINNIVVTYCGTDAALELFRVDNPNHGTKLLAHVCRHVSYEHALSDALKLCDAFTHLTKEDACQQFLEIAVISGTVQSCQRLLGDMFRQEPQVAQLIWSRAVEFCSMTLLDICQGFGLSTLDEHMEEQRVKYLHVSTRAMAILELVQDNLSTRILKNTPFWDLLDQYQRVSRLQKHHDIYLSPLELSCLSTPARIAQSLVALIRLDMDTLNERDLLARFEKSRRACELLVGTNQLAIGSVWYPAIEHEACQLVWTADDGVCVQFLESSGTLKELANDSAAQAVISVVLNLCKKASQEGSDIVPQMKLVLRASQLMHDYLLPLSPPNMLSTISSLSILLETVSNIFLSSDNGVGDELEQYQRNLRRFVKPDREERAQFKKPTLHPSWYVGDGLLLPMADTHKCCVEFCMDLVGLILCMLSSGLQGSQQLHRLLDERGAHSAALRVACLAITNTLACYDFQPTSHTVSLDCFSASCQKTLESLAERSLGGSGNGITNPKVDAQLSISYMHMLPTKTAFQVYKASLPTAITKRDFQRVQTLSTIGVVAGRGITSVDGSLANLVPVAWRKQVKFIEQCERLSTRAHWWMVLERFQVEFDPRRFDKSGSYKESFPENQKESQYALSLLDHLIANSCEENEDVAFATDLAFSFAAAFGVDKQAASQKLIEFLLSCPQQNENIRSDVRFDLPLCEKNVRLALRTFSSPMKRTALIRKCLVSLEGNPLFARDYERHQMMLTLYHDELSSLVSSDLPKKVDREPFAAELEFVVRRRDALSVLTSFFVGEKHAFRPTFVGFFTAFPILFNLEGGESRKTRSENLICVLGNRSGDRNVFDPLGPLHQYLSKHADATTATALAPLCVPLNLPSGYVHARALVSRFEQVSRGGGSLPSLEVDVLPILNKLKSARDQSVLADWCAYFYPEGDEQRMKCLDIALDYALKSSSEIERLARKNPSRYLESAEQQALDMVRRLSHAKATLSDKNQVAQILEESKFGDADHFHSVRRMIDDLTSCLNEDLWKRADAAPDKFVELLLTEASEIAATKCLSVDAAFQLDHLRYMATIVHRACKDISEQYSHVHAGALCRMLARRWLVHGDMASYSSETEHSPAMAKKIESSVTEDDDDTVNFVMDLSEIKAGDQMWPAEIGASLQHKVEESLVTKVEESSLFDHAGSAREASETDCTRVALRIAFIMSFAERYHPKLQDDSSYADDKPVSRDPKTKRAGLLSRIAIGDSRHESLVVQHGRELLRVVFAKATGSREGKNNSVSFLHGLGDETEVKSATFVMRYRALRTASILCPQEALERIVKEEGFLQNGNGEIICTLRHCAFGAFVAKEIEEMGLSLPHSDLTQLSTMQFSSYARALRRNHDNSNIKSRGRLLLLMVEMGTVIGQVWDRGLVTLALSEMQQMGLPRSLLFACERCLAFFDSCPYDMKEDPRTDIIGSIKIIAEACAKEKTAAVASGIDVQITVDRVETIIRKVQDMAPEIQFPRVFVKQGIDAEANEIVS